MGKEKRLVMWVEGIGVVTRIELHGYRKHSPSPSLLLIFFSWDTWATYCIVKKTMGQPKTIEGHPVALPILLVANIIMANCQF